jgi:amidophosphoribosyltransferase
VKWPCFYGIDFASRAELIANGLNTEEICRSLGADSLGYISLDGLVEATTVPMDRLCRWRPMPTVWPRSPAVAVPPTR